MMNMFKPFLLPLRHCATAPLRQCGPNLAFGEVCPPGLNISYVELEGTTRYDCCMREFCRGEYVDPDDGMLTSRFWAVGGCLPFLLPLF